MPNDRRILKIEQSFLTSEPMDRQITEIVDASDTTKSDILRGLVRAAYKMRMQGTPVCANCQDCRAPQLFMAFAPAPASQPTNRPDPDTNPTLVRNDASATD